jgi:hypothetical protein
MKTKIQKNAYTRYTDNTRLTCFSKVHDLRGLRGNV